MGKSLVKTNNLTPRNKRLDLQIKQPKFNQKREFSNKLVPHWAHLAYPWTPHITD